MKPYAFVIKQYYGSFEFHFGILLSLIKTFKKVQQTTTKAETTTIKDKLSEKTTVSEEIELDLFTGFEETTSDDRLSAIAEKSVRLFLSSKAVVSSKPVNKPSSISSK